MNEPEDIVAGLRAKRDAKTYDEVVAAFTDLIPCYRQPSGCCQEDGNSCEDGCEMLAVWHDGFATADRLRQSPGQPQREEVMPSDGRSSPQYQPTATRPPAHDSALGAIAAPGRPQEGGERKAPPGITERASAWIDRAYRKPTSTGEDASPRFTRYNMEVAYRAGYEDALAAAPSPALTDGIVDRFTLTEKEVMPPVSSDKRPTPETGALVQYYNAPAPWVTQTVVDDLAEIIRDGLQADATPNSIACVVINRVLAEIGGLK